MIVIKGFLGFNSVTIPAHKISGVEKSLTNGIIIETSGGQKKSITLWNRGKEDKAIKQIIRVSKL